MSALRNARRFAAGRVAPPAAPLPLSLAEAVARTQNEKVYGAALKRFFKWLRQRHGMTSEQFRGLGRPGWTKLVDEYDLNKSSGQLKVALRRAGLPVTGK
jgi:hypothetical protein